MKIRLVEALPLLAGHRFLAPAKKSLISDDSTVILSTEIIKNNSRKNFIVDFQGSLLQLT